MFVSYIYVTILCGGFSFSLPQMFRGGDSDLYFKPKRHARFIQGNNMAVHEPGYIDELPLVKQKSRNEDDIMPRQQSQWLVRCEPNCPRSVNLGESGEDDSFVEPAAQSDDEILLHMSADKDLMKFLKWTMVHLGSLHGYNASGNSFHSGLNMWKKLNLSGRRELPLYVEEPQYIVVRREPDNLGYDLNTETGIPFIPPRGRKYIPNLEQLLHRYELFVPNRGKKDTLKDIFKYDDLFFPNRGKKRFPTAATRLLGSYVCQLSEGDQRKLQQVFGNCFARSNGITLIPASEPADIAANINGLVSASTLHLPPSLLSSSVQVSSSSPSPSSSALDASKADGHQDAVVCSDAGAVAKCQKENNVKINGFDQSVSAQIHQQQHSEGGAYTADHHDRMLSSSLSVPAQAAASVETGASSYLPLIQPDQVRRLQPYPIRNKQWRDYYI